MSSNKTVHLLPVHCNSAHTGPAGSVSQFCPSALCDDSLGQTGSDSPLLGALRDLSRCGRQGLGVSWTSVQKLPNDWRTGEPAEPQWGGEDFNPSVLKNFISCSVAPNGKALEPIRWMFITCQTSVNHSVASSHGFSSDFTVSCWDLGCNTSPA